MFESPTFIAPDTREALGKNPPENRSLYFDRFADPGFAEERRNNWFEEGCKISVPAAAAKRVRDAFYPAGTEFLYAQLQARLLLNMSGGVMENAGLCLDRFGLPYIPGSAVKGCARRAALAALQAWTHADSKPDPADCFFHATAPFDTPETMLHQIAITFGWSENLWNEKTSDFLWALSKDYKRLARVRELPGIRGIPNQGGSVAFFAAYPNTDPRLELDIVTCHHPDYYKNADQSFAPDTENPNPVVFPAVRAQSGDDYFVFALSTLRNHRSDGLAGARTWLILGLEVFGLGAKTAAGHGWFDVGNTHSRIVLVRKKAAETEALQREKRIGEIKQDVRAKVEKLTDEEKTTLFGEQTPPELLLEGLRRLFPHPDKTNRGHCTPQGHDWFADPESASAAETTLMEMQNAMREELESAKLTGPEKEDRHLAKLSEQQFTQKVLSFSECARPVQEALVRAMRSARQGAWEDLKKRVVEKPKKYTQTADAIRRVSKEMNLGKMP